MKVETARTGDEITHTVSGHIFFASADAFLDAFAVQEEIGKQVRLDLSRAQFWDVTALGALETLVARYKAHGVTVEVTGLQLNDSLHAPLQL